jgi:hypothetical protein
VFELDRLFFNIYGQYHNSQDYGKLDEKWILPFWLEGNSHTPERLRAIMEQLRQHICYYQLRLLQRVKLSLQHPNDSLLGESANWPSSVLLRMLTTQIHSPIQRLII